MGKRIICIYRVEYNDRELGYMRFEKVYGSVDDGKSVLRTQLSKGYNSYAYAVRGSIGHFSKMFDEFSMTLVDEYEEYYT